MTAFTKVSIVGSGNVASYLGKSICKYSDAQVTHVFSRTKKHAATLASALNAEVLHSLSCLPNQPTFLCVSDDAIIRVLQEIPEHIPVAHTAGAVELRDLPKRDKLAVFYPLQTFSKDIDLGATRDIPILVEAEDKSFEKELQQLALHLSDSVHLINSAQRARLHVAAVFLNNFTTHLMHQAHQIVREQGIDFQLLMPLLHETIRKVETQSPKLAQTGPARRGDLQTIAKHKESLSGRRREIYALLTESIAETYQDGRTKT